MSNSTNPYKSPQVYWCHICDANKVDSERPETGKFYHVFGHEFETGDYTSVFFAICPDCTVIEACNEVKKGGGTAK
jgi:hypothetical protein